MSTVRITKGTYRGHLVTNATFALVKGYQTGTKGGVVTVDSAGYFGPEYTVVRVRVADINAVEFVDGESAVDAAPAPVPEVTLQNQETDEQVMTRIESRFDILDQMTKAAIAGDIRAMIVTGPPGVGKSYGVEYQLEKAGLFDQLSGQQVKYEVLKGAMTPIGLYCTLYKHSDPKNVLVFDDCDTVLLDDLSLNLLKAALDSGKKRRICWNADSHMLRKEDVPDSFDFKGSAIFITNLKFENIKSKRLQDHLAALQSRCHFLDLTLDTMRDKILRIRQIFRKGELFDNYNFTPEQGEEILQFMDENKNKLREMSLRMALKLADLTKVSPNWQALAQSTCLKHE